MSYPDHDGPDGPGLLRPLPERPDIDRREEAAERVRRIERECHERGYCTPIDADDLIFYRRIASPDHD